MELELPRLLTPDLSFDWYSWKKTYILFMSITRHGSSVFLVTTSLCRDQVIYASAAFLRSDSRFSCHFWFQYQCAIVNIFDEDEHLYANVNIFDSSIRISFHVITQPVQPHTMISGERCLMTRLLFFLSSRSEHHCLQKWGEISVSKREGRSKRTELFYLWNSSPSWEVSSTGLDVV